MSGRNLLSWQERIHLDVEYVDRMSFILDLRILGSTVRTVLSGSGVYGNQEKNPDMESSRK